MSRPTISDIVASVEGWDAEFNNILNVLRNYPWPITQLDNAAAGYANVAAFTAAYPPGSYDRCIVFAKINDQLPVWSLYWSDGATWFRVNGQNLGALLILSADFSIPDSVATRIDFDAGTDDPDGLYDGTNKGIKIKRDDAYEINAEVAIEPGIGTVRRAELWINGVIVDKDQLPPDAVNRQTFKLHKRLSLAANDVITVKMYQDSGGALNVIGAGTDLGFACGLSVTKVGKAG